MNADPEKFEELLQLLALKKHEQPPPGYFNRLPGQIMARLENDKEASGFWEKLFSGLVVRPALAYSVGLAFCGAFATSIFYAFQLQPAQTAYEPVAAQAWEYANSSDLASQRQTPSLHVAGFNAFDTNDSARPLPSLFNGSDMRAMPASYMP